jgi:hypothetical protein
VLTATAIHWFQPEEVIALYRVLARLLRVGGVFVNADHIPVSSTEVAALSQSLLEQWQEERLAGAEDYYDYRQALRDDAALRRSSKRATAGSTANRRVLRRRWISIGRRFGSQVSQQPTRFGATTPTRSSWPFVEREAGQAVRRRPVSIAAIAQAAATSTIVPPGGRSA